MGLLSFIRNYRGYGGPAAQRRAMLLLSPLEDRITPLVGQTAIAGPPPAFAPGALGMFTGAPLVEPGTGYDGVVSILNGGTSWGTGSLIQTKQGQGFGHHILTAAHNINPLAKSTITFTMPRPGIAVGVPISIPIAADANMQLYHTLSLPRALGGGKNEFDIAVLRMVDPEFAVPSFDRLLVAPYKAEQFTLYGVADEVNAALPGKTVTIVGYGMSGAGKLAINDGMKRVGQNTVDIDGTVAKDIVGEDNARSLTIDFDNGLVAQDYLGANYGKLHVGLAAPGDAMLALGDSGGPWLVGSAIVGVTRAFARAAKAGGVTTDIDATTNASFGEWGLAARVSTFNSAFIEPIVNHNANYVSGVLTNGTNDKYDLTFDMKYQAYGRSGGVENLTITAKKVGLNLEIWVDGPEAKLNGMYYQAPFLNIRELTLRGNDDNETVRIEGDLGISGAIKIDGRGGRDAVVFDYSGAVGEGNRFTTQQAPGTGWDMRLLRTDAAGVALPFADTKDIDGYTLYTGNGGDIIKVEKSSSALLDGLTVFARLGSDEVTVGAAKDVTGLLDGPGLADIMSKVFVDGGGDAIGSILYEDGPRGVANKLTLGLSEPFQNMEMQLNRDGMPAIYSVNIDKYTINAGKGGDTIKVDATSIFAGRGTFVSGNDGNDTVTVGSALEGLAHIATDVTVTGGAGMDTLVADDKANAGAATYRVLANRIERPGLATIFSGDTLHRTLIGAKNNTTTYVLGNPVGESKLVVMAGDGTDTVTVSGADGTLADIRGEVVLDGMASAGGRDVITFGDQGYQSGDTYTVRADRLEVARLADLTVTFVGFEDFGLNAGGGTDTVRFDGVTAAVRLAVSGGAGYDKLAMLAGSAYDPVLSLFERFDFPAGVVNLIAAGLAVEDMTQTGGVLDGPATASASKSLAWTGGTMQGTGRTEALAGSVATITGPVTLTARRFVNAGAGTWAGTITGGGTLENAWSGTLTTVDSVTLAGDLANNGSLRPAGAKAFGRVTVEGHFGHAGTLVVDLGPEGDGSDQVVAQTVTLTGGIDPYASQYFPEDYYTVVVDQSAAGGGQFGNAPRLSVHPFNQIRYKMFYLVDSPTYWGKAVLWALAGVSGTVFEDVNLDGLQPDRPMQPGVPVKLRRVFLGSDAWKPWDPEATTYSAPDGTYQFTDVLVGGYVVGFTNPNPDWWRFTVEGPGNEIDSDADRATGVSNGFIVSYTRGTSQPDAGLYKLATIGDRVWHDYYFGGDGLQGANEGGFAGLGVSLLNEQGAVLQSTTTSPDGYYVFEKVDPLPAGPAPFLYRVAFTKPADTTGGGATRMYRFSQKNAGPDDLDSDADPSTGRTDFYVVTASGEVNTTIDCGIQHWGFSGAGQSLSFDFDAGGELDAIVAGSPPSGRKARK